MGEVYDKIKFSIIWPFIVRRNGIDKLSKA